MAAEAQTARLMELPEEMNPLIAMGLNCMKDHSKRRPPETRCVSDGR